MKTKGAKATPLDFETHRLAPNIHRIAYPWGMRNNVLVFSGPEGSQIAIVEQENSLGQFPGKSHYHPTMLTPPGGP